jgi:hypothetical protein
LEVLLIRNPILKVLSILSTHQVRFLLMGGQACVFYGAAEFSRDSDIILLLESENLERFSRALEELQARPIAVPPFSPDYLKRGHAAHFRCHHPEASGIRIDVMAVLRGVASFEELWNRRTTVETETGTRIDLVSLPDLVQTKKTQRDKDWPVIRRLVEAHHVRNRDHATPGQVVFWLKECRTPGLLLEIGKRHPESLATALSERPLLTHVTRGDVVALAESLLEEEKRERAADVTYWIPL